ncbi:MAG: hypothetical protein ACN6O2_04505 [Stenotrophomonas sp.]
MITQPASSHITTTMMSWACLAMAVKGDRSAVQAIPTARRDERILFDMSKFLLLAKGDIKECPPMLRGQVILV